MPSVPQRLTEFTRAGLTFDVRDAGPLDSAQAPVILLHGFPQSSLAWSGVQPRLADAGLRTLAPDQRGYSPRARPPGRSAYRIGELGRDIVALIDALGVDKAHVVGHDWGGGVAWQLAMRHSDRLASMTVLSTPHPEAMLWAMRHGDQLRRSWYMFAMQVPVLPERRMAALMSDGGLERMGLDAEHARQYADLLLQPGAMTGAINWYRGMFARRATTSPSPRSAQHSTEVQEQAQLSTEVQEQAQLSTEVEERAQRASRNPAQQRSRSTVSVPVRYLWGRNDPHLGRAAAERTSAYCRGDYSFVELDAGHWLPETCADEVSRHIIDHCCAMSD